MGCVVVSQLPGHPLHREPLQRSPAEEDGPVPDRDPGGQAGRVQHQSGRVRMAAVAGDAQGEDPRQGREVSKLDVDV